MALENITLGIIGGGQLGKMTAQAAKKLGMKVAILTDNKECIAAKYADQTITSDYEDQENLQLFANLCDFVTYEFENIPLTTVNYINNIKNVNPAENILKITQNRLLEKSFVRELRIKTADFCAINNKQDLISGFNEFGKSILKTATLGYDGKGQFRVNEPSDVDSIWHSVEKDSLLSHGLILEKLCPFDSEASVIVARSTTGEFSCYDPLTNIHKDGILDQSIFPAKISNNAKQGCIDAAVKIAKAMDLAGLLAIEFFIMPGDEIYVNEMAPRPHNSGHFSMDASNTSQFKQLILAVTGQKLSDPSFHSSGHMQNLIGDDALNIDNYRNNPNAKIHIYGKSKIAKGRKMGHINIINK